VLDWVATHRRTDLLEPRRKLMDAWASHAVCRRGGADRRRSATTGAALAAPKANSAGNTILLQAAGQPGGLAAVAQAVGVGKPRVGTQSAGSSLSGFCYHRAMSPTSAKSALPEPDPSTPPRRCCCWETARPGGRTPLQCGEPAIEGRPWCAAHAARFSLGKRHEGRVRLKFGWVPRARV
jgi:hypothetical protein